MKYFNLRPGRCFSSQPSEHVLTTKRFSYSPSPPRHKPSNLDMQTRYPISTIALVLLCTLPTPRWWLLHEHISLCTHLQQAFTARSPNIINSFSSVNCDDCTWKSLSGASLNFTAVIWDYAYTARAGNVVGSANSSTSPWTMHCLRLARLIVHKQKKVTCYSNYACTDSSWGEWVR